MVCSAFHDYCRSFTAPAFCRLQLLIATRGSIVCPSTLWTTARAADQVSSSASGKRFYFAYDFDKESVSSWHRDDCKQWRKTDTETGWNTLLPSDTGHSLVFVSGRNGKSTICSCWQHISAEGLSHIFSSLATVAAKVQWPCDFFQGDHTQGDRIARWGLREKIN